MLINGSQFIDSHIYAVKPMAWHASTPYYANQSGHKYAQGNMFTERSNTNYVGFLKKTSETT